MKIAAFFLEYIVVSIELSKNYGREQWKDDLKKFLRKAGGGNQPTVFFFTDSHIKDESFLEDLNMLLNTGEVANLYPPDEKAEVCEDVRAAAKMLEKYKDGTPD